MIGLDTSVLARYLLNDDASQGRAAAALLSSGRPCNIPFTVLLELVWVLEINDCSRTEILKGIRHLLGLENISVREIEIISLALRWYEGGLDFADSLHLAQCTRDEGFATFDRALKKAAGKVYAAPPVLSVAEREW